MKFSREYLHTEQQSEVPEIIVEQKITPEKRAKSFLKNKYPLSEQGRDLVEKLQKALEDKDNDTLAQLESQIPTVENPRLELFAELDLTDEEKKDYFGKDLACVQVTKGCSHLCSYCAAASGRPTVMPFIAIEKIAQASKEQTKAVDKIFLQWLEDFKKEFGIELKNIMEKINNGDFDITPFIERLDEIKEFLKAHPIYGHLIKKEDQWKTHVGLPYWKLRDFLEMYAPSRGVFLNEGSSITHYYDSDPFDYRDPSVKHEDGTPADYGDVFQAFSTPTKPIHITTAGWRLGDETAKRGAEKIVEIVKKEPYRLSGFRVSVSEGHKIARTDQDKYLEMMLNVIETIKDVKPQILFTGGKGSSEEFTQNVLDKIRVLAKKYNLRLQEGEISEYSGRARNEGGKGDEDFDIMACMPGIHIHPDGSVNKQEYDEVEWSGRIQKKVKKGTRPVKVKDSKIY